MTQLQFLLLPLLQLPVVTGAENTIVLFQKAGVSLLVGILVGLERERSHEDPSKLFAGIRTFPLIGLLGFLSALVGNVVSVWLLVSLAACFFLLIIASYVFQAKDGFYGGTSEIAAVIIFILGVLIFWELYAIAIASSVVLVVFLSGKTKLMKFTDKVQEEDIIATLKFAIITAIILPILPDRTMGWLDVLNPRQIWYMVVLIAGISFLGYLLVKIFGSKKGISLTGMLGGLVSSTAVTLSFSHKSKEAPELARTFASSIILACSIMYPRILLQIGVVNSALLAFIAPYILILTATGITVSLFLLFGSKKTASSTSQVKLENPFELFSALKFGLLFALILFVSKFSQIYFGNNGIYLAAALAGLTDVDAITLGMASMAKTSISHTTASLAILIAILSNTIVKAGIAISIGSIALRKFTLPGFTALFVVGLSLVVWMLVW